MLRFVLRQLVRSPLQTLTRLVVLATSAALLGAMILFLGHALRTMTGSAARGVPVDWQAPVASAAAASRLAGLVAHERGIQATAPAATAPFAGIEHIASAGTVQSGAGAILAVPAAYPQEFSPLRLLRGSLRRGGVVLDQQLAATLRAQVGDSIALTVRRGHPAIRLRVTGIALLSAGDVLFQPLNPLVGPAPAQPPADVAIVPYETFVRKLAPLLGSAPVGASAAAAAPGTVSGVTWQVHAQVDPSVLTGTPPHALTVVDRLRNRVQSDLTGRVTFVDNLADTLSGAATDALYAEAMFILLALPGALIGLGLAYLAALGAVERDRRTLRLLSARGTSRGGLVRLAALESVVLGLCAGVVGTGGALVSGWIVFGGGLSTWPWALLACVGVACAGALAARVAAGARALAEGTRSGKPLWQKLYLDLVALAVSGLVYWLTARTGFSAVVNPDSNPTLSLSVYMFLAPALLWLGSALFLVRIRSRIFARLAPGQARSTAGFLLASLARRSNPINRGLVVVALLLAFAVNLAVFAATWDQQARVDAQLTIGADVVASGTTGLEPLVARAPGVAGTTAVDHTYAYVGPDLQDTFGIDAATFLRGSSLRDSYFLGGRAGEMLARLRQRRDAILVSKETITDYSLNVGDLLRLRVLDRRVGRFRVVPFHVVGIVQEFPSAPHDSFMVANLSYIVHATHDPGPNVVFAKAAGDPRVVAARVAAATARRGAIVKDIRTQSAQTVSSITTVDLRGIARIEGAFALVLAVFAMALYVAVAMAERRLEFATMRALRATPGRILGFLWSELALIVVAASALAALIGWLLAEMLVAMLQHAFDPPPDRLAVPWAYLGLLAGVTAGGAVVAILLARRAIRALPLGAILREE